MYETKHVETNIMRCRTRTACTASNFARRFDRNAEPAPCAADRPARPMGTSVTATSCWPEPRPQAGRYKMPSSRCSTLRRWM
eukprot:scaffold63354_cov36-Prasinocladus_malaysianus.AAC.2